MNHPSPVAHDSPFAGSGAADAHAATGVAGNEGDCEEGERDEYTIGIFITVMVVVIAKWWWWWG